MTINRDTTLFFDASVLVAGSHSPTGGSALLLEACKHGGFTTQTTFAVLIETLRTLDVKIAMARDGISCYVDFHR